MCGLGKSFNPVALVPSFVSMLQDCCWIDQVNIFNMFSSVPGKLYCMCWFFWLQFITFLLFKEEHGLRILNTALQQPLAINQRWLKRRKLFVGLGIIQFMGLGMLLHVLNSTTLWKHLFFLYSTAISTHLLIVYIFEVDF